MTDDDDDDDGGTQRWKSRMKRAGKIFKRRKD